MKTVLSLQHCLQLVRPSRNYFLQAQDINPATGKAYAINPSTGVWDDNYFSRTYGGASGNNNSTPSYSGPSQSAQQVQQQNTANENQFISNFSSAVNNLPSASSIYTNLANTLGITPIQNQLNQTQQNISDLTQKDTLGGGSLGLSAGQVAEKVATDVQPLNTLYGNLAKSLGIANQNLGTLFSGTMQQQQNQLVPWETQASFVGQDAANAVSMWSQQDQENFSQIMEKIQANDQLSNEEALQAYQYSQKLSEYNANPAAFTAINYPTNVPWYANPAITGAGITNGGIPSVGTNSSNGQYTIVG